MRLVPILILLALPVPAQDGPAYSAFEREGDGPPVPGYAVGYRGTLCLVTAVHPDQDVKAVSFKHPNGKRYGGAKAKVFQQRHSVAYIFPGDGFTDAVPYEAEFSLQAGDRLVAVSPTGQRIGGKLLFSPAVGEPYHSRMGPLRLMVITDEEDPDTVAGPGWPVFSEASGKVVGTVVVKRSVIKPHRPVTLPGQFSFEPLCLPSEQKAEPEMAEGIGGMRFLAPMAKDEFRWLLPGCLWEVEAGLSAEELVRRRGKLMTFSEPFRDHSFVIRDDTPVLYRVQYRPGPDKETRDRIVEIELEGSTNTYLGTYPKAEELVTVLEQAFGKPRVFSSSFTPNQLSGPQFLAHWIRGERSMTLRLTKEPLAISAHMVLGEERSNSLVGRIMEKHKLDGPPPSLVAAYREWVAAK